MRNVCVALALGLLELAFPKNVLAAEKRPNVLIVMTDDQGLGDFSFSGNPVLKTPHLDAFARQAVRLTDFHVCPMCSPTRGQLLTGIAALRNGATSVTAGRTFLRPNYTTLPAAFAKAGYRTGIFGKWHLGDSFPHRPMDKGFQESAYHLGWGQLISTPEFEWPLVNGRYFHNGVEKPYQGHCTDQWFALAQEWMLACHRQKEPFLCYLATNAPHSPHVELDEFVKPFAGQGPAGFFGMIAHVDRNFGQLMDFLANHSLAENTLVIFMTDNGGTAGVKLWNAGLRGGKTTYYEGGHRVPCWIRGEARLVGPPRDERTPTQNLDLLPTLCAWCGVPEPEFSADEKPYRGTSLAGLLKQPSKPLPDRTLVVQYGQTPKKFECCVVRQKWRLVHGTELYDVEADRAQKQNVAAEHPEVVQSLRDYYEAWWQGVAPRLNDFVPQSLGAPQQPVVELTSGDWEGIYADNIGFVQQAVGGPTGGHWHVNVEQAGTYEFTLRRWPARANTALGAAYVPPPNVAAYQPQKRSVSFPGIARARLEIAGQSVEQPADAGSLGVTLAAELPAGRTQLKAWFANAEGQNLCGAFFVTASLKVRRPQ